MPHNSIMATARQHLLDNNLVVDYFDNKVQCREIMLSVEQKGALVVLSFIEGDTAEQERVLVKTTVAEELDYAIANANTV